ncbi:MAG: diaminopimelate decarboxylase [bacterium]|nr:diaminopimelate decarboxylase [bacterium]
MAGFTYHNQDLYCDGVRLMDIAGEVGTPFYVYSEDTLRANYAAYQEGFAELDPLICYAYKANSNLSICRLLREMGGGADVLSGGELFRAIKAGVPSKKIVFNGNGKTKAELESALEADILMFNVDSKDELVFIDELAKEKGVRARIALRVNPDIDPGTHPYIATGLSESKFGVHILQAGEVYHLASELSHIDVIGIHTHIGSQITEAAPFVEALKKLTGLVLKLREMGINIGYINSGGGLGISYQEEDAPPTPAEMAKAFRPLVAETGCRLILEPGRSIVGNAGALIAEVLYIKETPRKNFLVVDAGMNDFIRPALYGGYHRIIPGIIRESNVVMFDIVGPICESGDYLGKERRLARPHQGDLMAVLDAGAYAYSMASNYNARPLLPEVLVKGEEYHLIRRRQTYQEMIAQEEGGE